MKSSLSSKAIFAAILIATLIPACSIGQGPTQAAPETKLGKFLKKTSAKYLSKVINLPKVDGKDTLFIEIVSAWSAADSKIMARGVRLTGYHYVGSGSSITETAFFDEEELPAIIEGLRSIVKEATPGEEVDFGDLGKEKVLNTIRVSSVEGTTFVYDQTLVDEYMIDIGRRGFRASAPMFSTLADRLERAAALLKKLK